MHRPVLGPRASALLDGRGVLAANPLPDDGRAEIGGSVGGSGRAGSVLRGRSDRSDHAVPFDPRAGPDSDHFSSIRTRGALKLASLNMNGAHTRIRPTGELQNKWMLINQLMRDSRLGILALQETHYSLTQSAELNELFRGLLTVYVSPDPASPTGARGVAFALNSRVLKEDSVVIRERIPGRALELDLTRRRGSRLTLLNLYAPNDHRESVLFWNELFELYSGPSVARPDVVLGDFNLVEDLIDRAPARPDPDAPVGALRRFLSLLGLLDGWRCRNGTSHDFSYLQQASGSQSRIDRIYLTSRLLAMSHSWTILPPGIPTDHYLVSVALPDYNLPPTGQGRWRLPAMLLSDKTFLDEAMRLGSELTAQPPPDSHAASPAQWRLLTYKQRLGAFARRRAKALSPKLDARIAALQANARSILRDDSVPLGDRERDAAILREEAAKLEERRFRDSRTRNQFREAILGETVSRAWIRRHMQSEMQDPIYELQLPAADEQSAHPGYTRSSTAMAEIARNFYDGLQRDPDLHATDHGAAVRTVLSDSLPSITDAERDVFDSPLSWADVAAALLSSALHKAPGLDGLPSELWLKLHRMYLARSRRDRPAFDVVELLTAAFNEIGRIGVASDSDFSSGWICPIYKLKGDTRMISNYRPITVLNADYKILTKVLATRVARVAGRLVHPDQAGFIPGRRIFDHTRLAQIMIDYSALCDDPGVIVALDQEKAYDRINHTYLWAVLLRMRFPASLVRFLQRLYERASSVVLLNGCLSTPFPVVRGMRQGDPISCLLFDLAIEPLAISLRAAPLRGFSVPGLTERLLVALFADDTTVYLSAEDDYATLTSVLERWCAASRAKFNVPKTEVIPVGPKPYRDWVRATRTLKPGGCIIPLEVRIVPDGVPVRLLGAWVGNDISQKDIWQKTVLTISAGLTRWGSRRPTLRGKRLAVGFEVGSRTQFLTRVQGMPADVEARLITLIRGFVWGNVRTPPVAMATLGSPLSKGGLALLDLHARNEAVEMIWVREYLTFGTNRPRWAAVADLLFARAVTAGDRRVDPSARINAFLQTWSISSSAQAPLPYYLRSLVRVARKFRVRFSALAPSEGLKDSLPIWYHFSQCTPGPMPNAKSAVCLRNLHGVFDVGKTSRVASRLFAIGRPGGHRPSAVCPCLECVEDRVHRGCDNPHRCALFARRMLNSLAPRWLRETHRPSDGLSLTPRRVRGNAASSATAGRILFDPSISATLPLSSHFRAFGPLEEAENVVVRRPPRGIALPDDAVEVYTDGSCRDNGTATALAGCGVWFADGDPRNTSALVPGPSQSNQAAELYAVSIAVASVLPYAPLHIVTDSKYVVNGLTSSIHRWEDAGWTNLANAAVVRDAVARLRARSAPTSFRWVKGHSGVPGNEAADRLAARAVALKLTVSIPPAPLRFVAEGVALPALTQKLAYVIIRDWKPTPIRLTSGRNLDLVAESVEEFSGYRPTAESVWTAVWRMPADRKIQAFWWKLLHGAHRVGGYWNHIPGYTQRATCAFCGALESMEHIVSGCASPWRLALWAEAMSLLDLRGIDTASLSYGQLLGLPVLRAPEIAGRPRPGDTRLLSCVLRELVYLTWVIRCEWVIAREGAMDWVHSPAEVVAKFYHRLNKCLRLDVMRTKRSAGRRLLPPSVVRDTWQGLVVSSHPLPDDWLTVREVLVGRPGDLSRLGVG